MFGSRTQNRRNKVATEKKEPVSAAVMTEAEYEQIFMQLLDRVAEGLTPGQLKGFLIGKKISEDELVVWLRGFGKRILDSSATNDKLATRLIQLGNISNGKLAMVAEDIGKKLLERRHVVGNKVEKLKIEEESLDSRNVEEFLNQGNALIDLGRYEEAINCFNKAI